MKNKVFMGNLFCAGLALSGLLAYAIINPFLLQDNLGLSPATYGLITLFIASGELVGTYFNSILVTRIGYSKMMFVGIAIMISAGALLMCLDMLNIFTISSIAVSTFLLTMSTGITIPNASAGAFSELTHSIGTAGAIYGFFQIIITIITTFTISSITHQSQLYLGIVFLSLALGIAVIYSLTFLKMSHEKILHINR
jgi:MFS family permease